jgi:transcriptional regulator with XRE-family HTH domain
MKKETSMADKLNAEREAIFAEEAFVVDVQILLNQIMKEKGFSRADLARAMNVSRARITQIFSDDCKNFTVRLLARAMHAMGEVPEVTCEFHMDQMRRKWEVQSRKLTSEAPNIVRIWDDETDGNEERRPANDNRMAGLIRHYGMAA